MSVNKFFGINKPATTKPLLPPCPSVNQITGAQLQFFDNGNRPRKKGYSRFTLKLEVYTAPSNIDITKPDWWRVIQLIEPKKVLQWAQNKWDDDGMTDDQLETYKNAYSASSEFIREGRTVWMGHISDPNNRGKNYFIGQFVLVTLTDDGDMQALVFVDGSGFFCDKFIKQEEGESGSRNQFSIYDPTGIIEREAKARAA